MYDKGKLQQFSCVIQLALISIAHRFIGHADAKYRRYDIAKDVTETFHMYMYVYDA